MLVNCARQKHRLLQRPKVDCTGTALKASIPLRTILHNGLTDEGQFERGWQRAAGQSSN